MQPDSKILLVDDEPLIRRSMQKSLQRAGFEVETAADSHSGFEAFQRALHTEHPFSLAILDLNMPDLAGKLRAEAGLELLSKILDVQPNMPVIVLTAYDEVGKAKEAILRGAENFFVKGREEGLINVIEEILG